MITLYVRTSVATMHDVVVWTRDVDTPHVPRQGDMVLLLPADSGNVVFGNVHRPHWGFDGDIRVSLGGYVIDPAEGWLGHLHSSTVTQWFTDRDGDLEAQLEAAGWERLDENHPVSVKR